MSQGMPAALTRGPSTVASTAMVMPIMPYTLPRREVSGCERPPRLRMKRMVAPMYATVTRLADMAARLFPEHGKHALGDGEAPEHVDRGQSYPGDCQPANQVVRPRRATVGGERRRDLHERADDDDAADRIRHAHERRVQCGSHVPHQDRKSTRLNSSHGYI